VQKEKAENRCARYAIKLNFCQSLPLNNPCRFREFLGAESTMSDDPFPKDAIFIKWGRFQAGIVGRLAIITVPLALVLAIAARFAGLW
jgi:hypothetical protein